MTKVCDGLLGIKKKRSQLQVLKILIRSQALFLWQFSPSESKQNLKNNILISFGFHPLPNGDYFALFSNLRAYDCISSASFHTLY